MVIYYMDEKIYQLYELLYSPIITPYNLLDNARLDNYEFVNYSKVDKGLLVSMKCTIDNESVIFSYYFDEKDFLQTVTMETDSSREIVFDRNKDAHIIEDRVIKQRRERTFKYVI